MTFIKHTRPERAFTDKVRQGNVEPKERTQCDAIGEELHDKLLFEQIHRSIIKDKLYLDPAFSRKTYIKLCLMNKNRVAKLVQKHAGTNLNGYINGLRLEHAARLLREKPELPIKAVAIDSGFRSRRTFYRLFAEKYGVTPTIYKERL